MFRLLEGERISSLLEEESEQAQRRNEAAPEAQRALENSLNSKELTPTQSSFVKTLTDKIVEESPPTLARERMPEPQGRVANWGGQIQTDRDVLYCKCGRLKKGHAANPGPCVVEWKEENATTDESPLSTSVSGALAKAIADGRRLGRKV